MKAGLSPKFNMPMARAPMTTPRLSHDRKVLSFAKKTLGSTRVGRAIRLPVGSPMLARRSIQGWSRQLEVLAAGCDN
jgi:hypothetical protein